MNKIILLGRLTKDPDVRMSQGANPTTMASFSLAVNRKYKRDGEPDADFFNCTAFGKQGEFVEKYLKKGSKILLTGRVQNDTYEKDGVKHYTTRIMVDEMEFAESKASGNEAPAQAKKSEDGFINIPTGIDDELPFA